jgi:hypothetical protein
LEQLVLANGAAFEICNFQNLAQLDSLSSTISYTWFHNMLQGIPITGGFFSTESAAEGAADGALLDKAETVFTARAGVVAAAGVSLITKNPSNRNVEVGRGKQKKLSLMSLRWRSDRFPRKVASSIF